MGNLKNKQLDREFAKPSEPEDTRESELKAIESNDRHGWDMNFSIDRTDLDRF